MNRKKQYGQSWWGQAWLNVFSKACETKYLKLGEELAIQGAVSSFLLNEKSVVETIVLGPNEKNCQQNILFRPIPAKEQEKILDTLQQKANILTQLLSQQLPITFASYVPKNLDEVHLVCSCSSDKQPCKHLVASLFVLAEKMDQNPFFIFELQGLDLVTALERRGLKIRAEIDSTFLTLEQLTEAHYQQKSYDLSLAQQLDFSKIENQWKAYLQLLSEETLFYSKEFKKTLQKNCRKAYKIYTQTTHGSTANETIHQQLKQTKDVALVIDENNQAINFFVINKGENQALFPTDQVLLRLIELLETVQLSELALYPDAFVALHAVYRFSMKLLKEQNFLPRLLSGPMGAWIQWIPAYNINAGIATLIDGFVKLCPSDLLLLEADQLRTFKAREQVLNLCHLFIGHYIQKATELIWTENLDKQVEYCFFSGQPAQFETEGLVANIELWLQQFYMGQRAYAPVLKVLEDKENGPAFCIQLLVQNKKEATTQQIDLAKFLKGKAYESYRFEVLKELQRLGQFFPDLKNVLSKEKTRTGWYSGAAFERLFFEILPVLRMLNIEVVLPRSLKQLTKPRLGLSIGKKQDQKAKGKSFMNAKSLLEVKWKIVIGDELIEAVEFFKMMKGQSGFVKQKEEYIYLDKEDLEKILLQLKSPPVATANQIIHAALSQDVDETVVEVQEEVRVLLNQLTQNPLSEPPKTLKANLRPYQLVGYSWMFKNAQLGLGSLIADDMGLGKTLQVISLLLKFKEEGYLNDKQALVIVPTSLITNWMNELAKFAPLLQPMVYHGSKRKLPLGADVIITTYGVARIDLKLLNQLDLYCTVIDEAQAIKNVNTAQTEAVKSIEATLNIAMSGTPVENRLSEYWSIMDYVNPNYLGSIGDFTETYSDPIEKDNDQGQLEAFRKITAPFILRRLKSDKSIIQDLPDKIERNYYATLQHEQAGLYKKVVDDVLHELAQLKNVEGGKKKRQGLILKLMSGLKQVCNHPYQYLKMGRKGPECSGKSQILMDLLTRIQLQQEKTLVFTQYRKMGNLMVEWVKERFGVEPMYLHGGCSRKQRDEMVDAFQNDKQQRIFILSLKAAGTGLNLTAANHVIHYDLWWNPAVETQATDRAYRIGQKKNVQVYRFISQGTMEEKIDAMIQSKKELADLAVSVGEQWLGNLSDLELSEIVGYQ